MDGAAIEKGGGGSSQPAPFLSKTYDMVDDASTDAVVSWSSGNNSFVVWNVAEFSRQLLPKHFKHNNFSSFVRQLNTYGFRKVDPDRWEFANEGFLRGQKHLLKSINRRKAPHMNGHAPQMQSAAAAACVEVGKFGLEEEVERLKRDKNILMQELVRLKQQQQSTDHQLQTVGQRVQMMEQRQQQMMSFLAKAMQSPGFMTQLVQQQNESNMRIMSSNSNKKRRLPNQDEANIISNYGNWTANGQVTKFQPQLNEAAVAMLQQILNMNLSTSRESSMWKPDAYLIDDVSSSRNAFESGSSSNRISSVSLAEVTPSGSQCSQFERRYPDKAEVQSPPDALSTPSQSSQYPGAEALNVGDNTFLTDLSSHLGIPKNIFGQPGASVPESGGPKAGSVQPMMLDCDGSPAQSDTALSDNHDDNAPKLPDIDDVFWEQFLSTSPLTGETDDMSSVLDDGIGQELDITSGQEGIWNRGQHMDQLTEQMGLLTSEGRSQK